MMYEKVEFYVVSISAILFFEMLASKITQITDLGIEKRLK